ncbi:unnamed protein product [Caenorhabditis sp. 36 PRJEB53466]|nr:unnamed protein product [Caenorhabditis sp. 36 PRJEB53466]
MRTMDQGQLQKLLNASAAQQNPMMLFAAAMTQQPTTPTHSASAAASAPSATWQLKSPQMHTHASSAASILEANVALLILQQLQNQQSITVTLPTPPITTSSGLPAAFSLPVIYPSTSTVVSTPAITPTTTSSSMTPQCSTPNPPEMISTINKLLQMQAQKSVTPPDPQVMAPRKISLPEEFVPIMTPSSSASASSPSTSSKKGEEDEDDDEDEFVDIESVDVAVDGKEKRRAHVEFYRRMKYMRQQDKALTCGECKKKIENQENAIAVHVAEHADAGGYQCRLCGWQSIDKYKIYSHMRVEHPRKVDMFVDKRDMPKMCVTLSQCFPKTTCRPKKESNRNADSYLMLVLKGGVADKLCNVCKGRVRRDKAAMIRHVQTNHTIKCKTCKTISATLDDQLRHQKESHGLAEPKMSVHYAPSAAAVYLLPALEKCFPPIK